MAAGNNKVYTNLKLLPSSSSSSSAAGSSDFKTLTILLVDDEYLCLTVTKALLEQAGHLVTMTGSALDALNILRSTGTSQFDIILSDLYMPEMNGLQLIEQVAKENIGIPVALLSADEEPMTMQKALAAGAASFYHKPVNLDVTRDLSQVVDSWKIKTIMMIADHFPYTINNNNQEDQLQLNVSDETTAASAVEWNLDDQQMMHDHSNQRPSIDDVHYNEIMAPLFHNYNDFSYNNNINNLMMVPFANETSNMMLNPLPPAPLVEVDEALNGKMASMEIDFHHRTIAAAARGESSSNGAQLEVTRPPASEITVIRRPSEQQQEEEKKKKKKKANAVRLRKKKMIWTDELHHRFVDALNTIGPDKAVPTTILREMNQPGVTRDQVSSHLQRHRRLDLKKPSAIKKKKSMQTPRA